MAQTPIPGSKQAKTYTNRKGETIGHATVAMPIEWLDQIDLICEATYLTRSDIIRTAIREYLATRQGA